MPMRQSPATLAWLVVIAMLLCVTLFISAVLGIRDRANEAAALDQTEQVASAMAGLGSELRRISDDYSHWTEAYEAAMARDVEWMHDNYAISATAGQLFDGVVFFGGPIDGTWAWTASAPQEEPVASFLPNALLADLEAQVRARPVGQRNSIEALAMLDGMPVLLAATFVQPYDAARASGLDPATLAISVIVRTLGPDAIDVISERLRLPDLRFGPNVEAGWSSLPFGNPGGLPLGLLSWPTPRPADAILREMAPVLGWMAVLMTLLGLGLAWLIRSRAASLEREEALARSLSFTDPMTGLPNRLAVTRRIEAIQRERPGRVAIVVLDINDFKPINDAMGHGAGDSVILEVARRLKDCVPAPMKLVRFGGDEFVIMTWGEAVDEVTSGRVESRIRDAMAVPIEARGTHLHVRLAQGYAVGEGDDVDPDELLRQADIAMYRAKRDGRVDAVAYTSTMEGEVQRDQEMEAALRQALVEHPDEFGVLYQPIVRAKGRALERVEALARWQSAALGPVPPSLFVPLAERAGLIGALSRLLMERAFWDVAEHPGLHLAVNLSPVQLRDPNFLTDLDALIARYGIDPRRIELEITEGVLIERTERAGARLEELRSRGFRLALDDFGTGFSSLGYLTSLPVDTLKIDQQFLRGATDLRQGMAVVRSILRLAHAMGKTVVCEGVETEEQAAALARMGCDLLQGYRIAFPLDLDTLLQTFPEIDRQAA